MKNPLIANLLIVAMILFLNNCETVPSTISPKVKSFPVEIISEPSAAKIEVNNNYIGETPLTINLEGWESTRTFIRSHRIVAHPVRAGGQLQSKYFSGWSEPDLSYGDNIPITIYFNMNLIRIPEEYNINIDKNKP